MRSRLSKFAHLSNQERIALLQSLALLPLVSIGLMVSGFKTVKAVMEKFVPMQLSESASDEQLIAVKQIARMVDIASRRGWHKGNCLRESLVTWWLLARRGIQSTLHFGIRQDDGALAAHAWIEYRGIPLNNPATVRDEFATFESAL